MASGRMNGFYFIKNGKKFVGALRRAADDDPNVSKMFLDNLGGDRMKKLIVSNEIEKGTFYNAVAIAFDWPTSTEGKDFWQKVAKELKLIEPKAPSITFHEERA